MTKRKEYSCKLDTIECDAVTSMLRLRALRHNYSTILDLSFYDIDGVAEYLDEIFGYRTAMGLAHTITTPIRLEPSESSLLMTNSGEWSLVSKSRVMSGAAGHPLYSVILDGVEMLVLKGKTENDWIVYSVDTSLRPLYTPHSLAGPQIRNVGNLMIWELYISDKKILEYAAGYNDADWTFLTGGQSCGSNRISAVVSMYGWVDLRIGERTRRFNTETVILDSEGCYICQPSSQSVN